MCGIWAFIDLIKQQGNVPDYNQLFADFMKMKARGPDSTDFQIIKNLSVGFHRLAIMEPSIHANQPYIIKDGERTVVFVCNGEIYDFKELIQKYDLPIHNNADCMTILQLYLKYVKHNSCGKNDVSRFTELFSHQIKGEYAFLLFEFDRLMNLKEVVVGRSTCGERPLFFGYEKENSSLTNPIFKNMIFSSEVKGCLNYQGHLQEFEPGTIMHYHIDDFGTVEYEKQHDFKTIYNIVPMDEKVFKDDNKMVKYFQKRIRDVVVSSLKRRLPADVPIGFLVSGGVDSSSLAGIASKILGHKIRTFCGGMVGGTDLKYGKIVADYINSDHTEIIFTAEDALKKIKDVIYFSESFCVTSIRASIMQNLVCEYISKNTDVKVVIVGEGVDEVASSYLTNWYAPSGKDLHDTALDYVKNIHLYDGRRVDRNVSNYGLEARVTYLDPSFIQEYFSIPSEWRRPQTFGIEKYFVRSAFMDTGILPDIILSRKKEAFSDGVSSTEKSWFKILQEHIEPLVSDEEFENNKWNCVTKEQYYYMKVFCEFFGERRLNIIPKGSWLPKWNSSGEVVTKFMDPSARVLSVYNKDEQKK